jgi:hypothetical protein
MNPGKPTHTTPHTEESKAKISASMKGRVFSENHKRNLTKAKLGKRSNHANPDVSDEEYARRRRHAKRINRAAKKLREQKRALKQKLRQEKAARLERIHSDEIVLPSSINFEISDDLKKLLGIS